jgi:16S rRNA (cytosine1402-N4)-methyltransferase
MSQSCHVSVLLNETLESLKAGKGGVFLDCTLGGGGHSLAILEAHPENKIVALDKDKRAVERSKEKFKSYGERFSVIQIAFGSVKELRAICSIEKFDGVLADLGTSMDQLKEERGFSFHDEAPLDMRMNEEQAVTLATLIDSVSSKELTRLLKIGGVGAHAYPVANSIVSGRPYASTKQLAEAVLKGLPARIRRESKVHPATVVFQALRIAVNQEFDELRNLLEVVPSLLVSKGRCAVICFHSLEDKVVAGTMRKWAGSESAPAKLLSVVKDSPKALGSVLTKKPIVPSDEEINRNPSSRSARLRVFEFF